MLGILGGFSFLKKEMDLLVLFRGIEFKREGRGLSLGILKAKFWCLYRCNCNRTKADTGELV